MAFIDSFNDSQDPTFQKRVAVALQKTAIAVFNEAPSVQNHADRARFANAVLTNPTGYAERHAIAIVADGTVTQGSTDIAIENRCSALWDAWAGAGLASGAGPPTFQLSLVTNALTHTNAPSGGLEVTTGGGSRVQADLRGVSHVRGEVVCSVIPATAGVVRFEYSVNGGSTWDTIVDMLTSYTADQLKVSAAGAVPTAAKVETCLMRLVVTGDGVADPVVQKACLVFQAQP